MIPAAPGTADSPTPGERDLPAIFIAIQEQLGLRLQPARDEVSVLVIDHIERPAPD